MEFLESFKIELPTKDKKCRKKTLLLDLDETLIHTHVLALDTQIKISYNVVLNYELKRLGILIRPYLKEFL